MTMTKDTTLLDIIAFSELQTLKAILIDRERIWMVWSIKSIKHTSKLETEVLVLFLEGLSYQEIAEKVGKSIRKRLTMPSNVLRKLESTLREGDEGNY